MRLTNRCIEILKLIKAARWTSTSQLRRRFWPHATADAARKRLRILSDAKFLRRRQEHRMMEALFTLGVEGKAELERRGDAGISLDSRPPKHREHFLAVNDIRVAAELTGRLDFFFGYWELPAIGWQYALIPDAVFSVQGRRFGVEVDRGKETTKYFVKSKMGHYVGGLAELRLERLLIVTERKARALSLSERIGQNRLVLYALLEDVRRFGIEAPIFIQFFGEEGKYAGKEALLPGCPGEKRAFG